MILDENLLYIMGAYTFKVGYNERDEKKFLRKMDKIMKKKKYRKLMKLMLTVISMGMNFERMNERYYFGGLNYKLER